MKTPPSFDYYFENSLKGPAECQKQEIRAMAERRCRRSDRLPFMFAPGEIDYLHMFFPDPWPKKAHQKNRTANATWLRSIAPLLSKRGYFHLKTDHRAYFDFIIENIESMPEVFKVLEKSYDLHAGHPNPLALKIPEVTLFERLFIKDGLPIHSVKITVSDIFSMTPASQKLNQK